MWQREGHRYRTRYVRLVCTSGTKASDCNHDETAKVGGAILSFVLFMMQSYNAEAVSSAHALPLASQSFDGCIHVQQRLRLLFFVIVCQVRYGKLFKESSASVLALVLLLAMQHLLFRIFAQLVSKCAQDFQALRVQHTIITTALSMSASAIVFFFYLLCFPHAFSFSNVVWISSQKSPAVRKHSSSAAATCHA